MSDFTPQHDFFIGIDSDGCVFDTMEVKHKECFIPKIVQYYQLAAVSKYARQCAEFVNLYSKSRGINRFPALVEALDWLRERPEVKRRGVEIPKLDALRSWMETESTLGNPTLMKAVEQTGDPELSHCLSWSTAVNAAVGEVVTGVAPFPGVRESLQAIDGRADVFVVSATPNEALEREWSENDLRGYVHRICGQEAGGKSETLAVAGRYPKDHALMLGDAPGDMNAALKTGCLFFPIDPGAEEESWGRFAEEGLERFFAGAFAGDYQKRLTDRFEQCLPAEPPWQR